MWHRWRRLRCGVRRGGLDRDRRARLGRPHRGWALDWSCRPCGRGSCRTRLCGKRRPDRRGRRRWPGSGNRGSSVRNGRHRHGWRGRSHGPCRSGGRLMGSNGRGRHWMCWRRYYGGSRHYRRSRGRWSRMWDHRCGHGRRHDMNRCGRRRSMYSRPWWNRDGWRRRTRRPQPAWRCQGRPDRQRPSNDRRGGGRFDRRMTRFAHATSGSGSDRGPRRGACRRLRHWRSRRLGRNRLRRMNRGRYRRRGCGGFFHRFGRMIVVVFFAARGVDVALHVRTDQSLSQQLRDIFVD